MRRREFITGLGAVAARPIAAGAQRSAIPVIGFLHSATLEAISPERIGAFHTGLAELGFIEGQNVAIDYRWANGRNDQLPSLAADLVRRQVSVIATPGTTASALAAKAATRSIPIVFMFGTDPVASGIVASLNRPGGNLTGVSLLTSDSTIAKRLQFLHELVPGAGSIALIVNPDNPVAADAQRIEAQRAARVLGLRLLTLTASNPNEIDAAFTMLVEKGSGGLLMGDDSLFNSHRDQLAALAARHTVPAIYSFRELTTVGGLMSYGPSLPAAFRIVGLYTGRILKGEKPADLPVQQATKLELVINLKTAKALGLTVPETLLATADEVIQ
jgi:putative tryptophan/tyrosine transport system substrate-binding protein